VNKASCAKTRHADWQTDITDPAAINMAGGMPFPAYFVSLSSKVSTRDDPDRAQPFDTLEANVALPTRYNPDAASTSSGWLPGWTSKPKKQAVEHLKVDKFAPKGTMPVDKIDLASALQYGTAVCVSSLGQNFAHMSAGRLSGSAYVTRTDTPDTYCAEQ
jgi:hypothetical protein